ncbi:MAG: hypothetical protein Q4F66_05120 [Clostridium sp.]|nr:hypothetical protein [Clostridium sp.]
MKMGNFNVEDKVWTALKEQQSKENESNISIVANRLLAKALNVETNESTLLAVIDNFENYLASKNKPMIFTECWVSDDNKWQVIADTIQFKDKYRGYIRVIFMDNRVGVYFRVNSVSQQLLGAFENLVDNHDTFSIKRCSKNTSICYESVNISDIEAMDTSKFTKLLIELYELIEGLLL